MIRKLTCLALVAGAPFGLSACTSSSSKQSVEPSGTKASVATSAAARPSPNGTAALTVDGKKTDFKVVCTKTGNVVSATGDSGISTATMVVAGPIKSVVLAVRAAKGGSTTYQAVDGLRDAAGRSVGKVTVTAKGDTYSGDLTFVSVELDAKGAKVKQATDTETGSFTLTCSSFVTVGAATPTAVKSTK